MEVEYVLRMTVLISGYFEVAYGKRKAFRCRKPSPVARAITF